MNYLRLGFFILATFSPLGAQTPDGLDEAAIAVGQKGRQPTESRLSAAVSALVASPVEMAAVPSLGLRLKPLLSAKGPWTLNDALEQAGAPDWLKLSGEIVLRYEGILGQFRPAARLNHDDHALVMRTVLRVDIDPGPVAFVFEGADARQVGGNRGSALSTGIVNALELLQAHVTFRLDGGRHQITAGRMTFDIGSRRFVARNIFRNTINAFTGVKWHWETETFEMTAFHVLPIRRRPDDLASLIDNDIAFDDEGLDVQLSGVSYERGVLGHHRLQVFAFALFEDDDQRLERDIISVGARFRAPRRPRRFDYEIEAVFQFGRSRLSPGGQRLEHRAGFVHASAGYSFDAPWRPHVRLALDWASGDDDPSDDVSNRFDTLYGVPREFGPTSLFRPEIRSNLLSPELRVTMVPRDDMNWMVAWRGLWLSSRNDVWAATGIRDITGRSGRFVGHQLETRWRWNPLPEVGLQFEVGLAYLFHGAFQEDAPGGQGRDTFFSYVQTVFTF